MEEHEETKETQKKRKFNTKNLTEKIRKNPWMLATVLLSVFCLVLLVISFSGNLTGKVISEKEVGNIFLTYITSLGADLSQINITDISSKSGIYAISFDYNGVPYPIFYSITKDGKLVGLLQETETTPEKTVLECATEYEVEEEIIFYYSDSCGWCAKMKPGVEELEKDGYKFKWIEASDSENSDVINNCIKEHMTSSGVPQFICVKTGEIHVGAFADENANLDQIALKAWVDNCLSAN